MEKLHAIALVGKAQKKTRNTLQNQNKKPSKQHSHSYIKLKQPAKE
jgi:hypothetical protein